MKPVVVVDRSVIEARKDLGGCRCRMCVSGVFLLVSPCLRIERKQLDQICATIELMKTLEFKLRVRTGITMTRYEDKDCTRDHPDTDTGFGRLDPSGMLLSWNIGELQQRVSTV